MPKFRKIPVIVDAEQLEEDFRTDAMQVIGFPGDWLIVDPAGDIVIVPDEYFRANYEPAEPEASLALFGAKPQGAIQVLKNQQGQDLVYREGIKLADEVPI